jgi:hypothetical protein
MMGAWSSEPYLLIQDEENNNGQRVVPGASKNTLAPSEYPGCLKIRLLFSHDRIEKFEGINVLQRLIPSADNS